jgi:predicted SAM-dependent methyltransferase
LGCGPGPQPSDWINLDGSWNAWFAKRAWLRRLVGAIGLVPAEAIGHAWDPAVLVHNVEKGLPFADGTMTAVYSSHMLEHLYSDRAEQLLAECFRVLAPGGIVRIVVPDLHAAVARYLAGPRNGVLPADALNELLNFRSRTAPGGGVFFRAYSAAKDFHSHKWMYDAESLAARLAGAGFVDIQRREAHQSRIDGINRVERADRVSDVGLCLEAVKPAPRGEGAGRA